MKSEDKSISELKYCHQCVKSAVIAFSSISGKCNFLFSLQDKMKNNGMIIKFFSFIGFMCDCG
jgi:hypothetical protein